MGPREFRKLRTLDLGENRIGQLREGDFDGLKELYGLRVSGNALAEISKGHFANSSNLHVLNLARNKLAKVEQGCNSIAILLSQNLSKNLCPNHIWSYETGPNL